MRISVVIATYDRLGLLLDLLGDLARQTLPPSDFEVIVVDDGSRVPAGPEVERLELPYPLIVRTQANRGPAAARHAGILAARHEIIVILDDDMSVAPDFLARHLAAHGEGATVVQGSIAPPPDIGAMPLFERFHADQLERFEAAVCGGRERFRGIHVCTGNVSFRRADYLAVGGFDPTFPRSEDRELGVRLEKAGGRLVLSARARSAHRSDHQDLATWMRRARYNGIYDLRIARKHPDVSVADPWRFMYLVNPVSRPFLLGAVLVPRAGRSLSRLAFAAARLLDRGRGRRAALAGATFAFGLQYFAGVRQEYGSLLAAAGGLADYVLHKRAFEVEGAGPARTPSRPHLVTQRDDEEEERAAGNL